MMRSLSFLLFTVALSAQITKRPEPKPYADPEAYRVYAAALQLEHREGELLIAERSVPFRQCLDSRSDKVVGAVIKQYEKTNQTVWHLQDKFLDRDYRLISEKEIAALRRPDPEGGFFWTFPNGMSITHLSAVGFNATKAVAFVAIDFQCGGVCGAGRSYILEKRANKWQEYESKLAPRVIKRKKNKDGTEILTMRGPTLSSCTWNY
jgi:hypothetical protein